MSAQISLVIINRDDRRVENTLQALTELEEVRSGRAEIVVIDASEGRLADISLNYPDVRWIDFTPILDTVTIAHQRNVGLAHASGEIIVFIDAACLPVAGWLGMLCDPIVAGDEQIVAGANRSPDDHSLRNQATERLADLDYVPEAPTISLALHRSVFERVGLFDERFAYGSDVDFTWRAVDAGFRIRYVASAVVIHDWGPASEELRRSWKYGRARARLYLKHRGRWRQLFGSDLPLIAYPAYLLLLPFTLWRPRFHLVLLLPIYRNRGRRPFATVVDHFIRAAAGLVEVCSHVISR